MRATGGADHRPVLGLSLALGEIFETHTVDVLGRGCPCWWRCSPAGRCSPGSTSGSPTGPRPQVKSRLRRDVLAAVTLANPVDSGASTAGTVTLVTQGLDADGYYSKYRHSWCWRSAIAADHRGRDPHTSDFHLRDHRLHGAADPDHGLGRPTTEARTRFVAGGCRPGSPGTSPT
ncbi:MAG: hypothetical protein R2719_04070 [Micropruina sp.]